MDPEIDPETRYPVQISLPDISLAADPLEAGERVEYALVILEIADASDRSAGWSYRTSEAPNREELLGALEVLIEKLKSRL